MGAKLDKLLRLADDSEDSGGGDNTEDEAQTPAVAVTSGMVVTHPTFTGGKAVRVTSVANRGTHMEIMTHHAANGRPKVLRVPHATKFTVKATPGDLHLPKGQQVSLGPGMQFQ